MPPHYPHNRLAEFRNHYRLSQSQAAFLIGCGDRQKIARYERGERLPSLRSAASIAAAYQTSLDQLFPEIFAQANAEVHRNQKVLTQTFQSTAYEPASHNPITLALYPGTRKIGMAVFEKARLIEASVRNLRIKRVPWRLAEEGERLASHLFTTFCPETLVMEKTPYRGSRRSRFLPRVVTPIKALARKRSITVIEYTPREIKEALSPPGTPLTKADLCQMIATRYPELTRYLPQKPRGIGDTEPHYTSLFMAVALGLTWIKRQGKSA